MKNFLKKHFYTIPEAFNKDDNFIDFLRRLMLLLLSFLFFIFEIEVMIMFIYWDLNIFYEVIRLTLVLIFFYFLLLKKWWKSND